MTTLVKLQATGHLPQSFEGRELACHEDKLPGDKRGVRIAIYQGYGTDLWCEVRYQTLWGTERPCTYVESWGGPHPLSDKLTNLSVWVRNLAPRIMPPGSGYPAGPQFADRQAKLAGMMETLTLHVLTECLRTVAASEVSPHTTDRHS